MHTPNSIEAAFIFFPQPQLRGDPSHVGLRFDDVWLTTEDGNRTHAWFIRGQDDDDGDAGGRGADGGRRRVLMLLAHGNGGNISVRLDQYREFVDRYRFIDVLALEYRGYGLSGGSPSEEGLAQDARAARRWIDDYVAEQPAGRQPRVVYFGRSLGGAVATRLAAEMPPDGLVLECPVSSIPDLARNHAPWKYLPIDRFIYNRFDAVSAMREVQCPVLVMHSEFDEIVPIECGRTVFDAAVQVEDRRFYVIRGASHNGADLFDVEGYYGALGEFLGLM